MGTNVCTHTCMKCAYIWAHTDEYGLQGLLATVWLTTHHHNSACSQWNPSALTVISHVVEWECAEIYSLALKQVSLIARWGWYRRMWEVKADTALLVGFSWWFISSSQHACWYLLPCQQGLNQVSLQWVDLYLCVQTFLRLCEKADGSNILFCCSE